VTVSPRHTAGLYSAALAAVAQLARASACHAEGRGFESLQPLSKSPPNRRVLCWPDDSHRAIQKLGIRIAHTAYSLDPFALWTAFPPSMAGRYSHDYYGSSATPRRQQRTVRLPQTPRGSAGTAGALPTFTIDRSAGSAPSYTPGVSSRATATPERDLARPNRDQTGRDGPEQVPGPSTPTAHSRQFPGCCAVSGLLTLVRLLHLSALLARHDVDGPAPLRSPADRSVPHKSLITSRPHHSPGRGQFCKF
jgi:hypothetical protein